nr:caspase family protein [Brasilonema octagenarum UFV-OR1]
TELEATQSWCELKPLPGKEPVKQGDRAVLTSASTNLVRKARLLYLEEAQTQEEVLTKNLSARKLPQEIYKLQKDAFQNVKDALVVGKGWIELVPDQEKDNKKETVHYIIAINSDGEYEICDRTGTPYANMRPLLKVDDPDAAANLVKRLVHLAKYHATQALDNFDKNNPLMGKLTVEWIGKRKDYDPVDPITPDSEFEPLDDPNNPTIEVGEFIFLRIRNNYWRDLNVAVLDLGSDWSIAQAHPQAPGEKFITLDPEEPEVIIPFCLSLPDGYKEGADIAKVFATVGSPNFRWLELPPLDKPLAAKGIATRGGDPLENLFAAIDDEEPKTRKLESVAYPSREWITKQVKVNVKAIPFS